MAKKKSVESVIFDCPACEGEFEVVEGTEWIRCPHCRAYYKAVYGEEEVYIEKRVAMLSELKEGDIFWMPWRREGKEEGEVVSIGVGSVGVNIPYFEAERTGSERTYLAPGTIVEIHYEH